jgi:hypothetical protein
MAPQLKLTTATNPPAVSVTEVIVTLSSFAEPVLRTVTVAENWPEAPAACKNQRTNR